MEEGITVNHHLVQTVIDILNKIEVDGETIQHILKETEMEWQMLRQLIMTLPIEQVEYLIEERKDLGL